MLGAICGLVLSQCGTQPDQEFKRERYAHLANELAKRFNAPTGEAELRGEALAGFPKLWEVREGPTSKKLVALTFDDGPRPDATPQILKILAQERVSSTFFMIGSAVETYPQLASQVAEAGHEIANHTFDHPLLPWLSPAGVRAEFLAASEQIHTTTGQLPRFFRPPGGHASADITKMAAECGLRTAYWTFNPGDLDQTDPARLAKVVKTYMKPGSIVLLHDAAFATQAALPQIIKDAKKHGYRFVTLSELMRQSEAKIAGAQAAIPKGRDKQ